MTFRSLLAALLGAAAALTVAPQTSKADDLYTENGLDLRWDNSLRYTSAIRLSPQNPTLLANPNADDGDRDFSGGPILDRIDLMSQLDLSAGDFGFHASAAGWYDSVYHGRTDNRSDATYNASTVPASHFAPAVRDLEGQYGELEDAFVYGTFGIGDVSLSARLGRQTVLWGESLFYDANSIASAQAPTDYARTVTGQSSYGNNVYLPVTQLSVTAQLLPDLSLTFYNHFGARRSRQVGDGSYFSYADFLGAGADRYFLPTGQYLLRQGDGRLSAGGQYGVALHALVDGADLGFYVLQYNAADPQIIMTGATNSPDPALAGFYRLVYPRDIMLIGASASTSLGDATVAGEVSLRRNAPLLAFPKGGPTFDSDGQIYVNYVKGDLVHAQASAEVPVGSQGPWDSADLNMEVAADEVGGVTSTHNQMSLERFAMKARLLFEPRYFQLFPNLDLSIPLGIGYNLAGHGFTYYAQNGGTGDVEIGVNALYRSVWRASLTVTSFIGTPDRQPLSDRDFLAFSLERTF